NVNSSSTAFCSRNRGLGIEGSQSFRFFACRKQSVFVLCRVGMPRHKVAASDFSARIDAKLMRAAYGADKIVCIDNRAAEKLFTSRKFRVAQGQPKTRHHYFHISERERGLGERGLSRLAFPRVTRGLHAAAVFDKSFCAREAKHEPSLRHIFRYVLAIMVSVSAAIQFKPSAGVPIKRLIAALTPIRLACRAILSGHNYLHITERERAGLGGFRIASRSSVSQERSARTTAREYRRPSRPVWRYPNRVCALPGSFGGNLPKLADQRWKLLAGNDDDLIVLTDRDVIVIGLANVVDDKGGGFVIGLDGMCGSHNCLHISEREGGLGEYWAGCDGVPRKSRRVSGHAVIRYVHRPRICTRNLDVPLALAASHLSPGQFTRHCSAMRIAVKLGGHRFLRFQ